MHNAGALLTYSELVDSMAAELEKKLPDAEPGYLERLAIVGLEYAAINWGRLASHEAAHVYAARKAGLDAHIERIGLREGLTMLEGPATADQLLAFRLGGLNQTETNLIYLHKETARRGSLSLGDSLVGLSNAFDDTLYTLNTWRQDQKGDPWQYADPSNIQASFRSFGKTVTYEHQLAKALVADLLSTLTWDSLAGVVSYVRTGQRVHERTTFELGGTEVTGPDVALLRSAYGDTFRVMATVAPKSESPWDVRLDLRTNPDDWNLNAVGARVQKLDAARIDALDVTLSPYVGVSKRLGGDHSPMLGREEGAVVDLGFEFNARVNDRIELHGNVGVGKSWDGALHTDKTVSVGVKIEW